MSALGEAAARLNLPAFPCNADKRPITSRGLYDAATSPAEILRMFSSASAAMIGVPTGAASGLIGIDVDIKNGARGTEWLDANSHRLPPTRTHRTRSGGLHLIFLAPPHPIRNSVSVVAPGVDVRGDGGYVVFPPSPGYAIADDTPPAEMPDWLIAECAKKPPRQEPSYTPTTSNAQGGTPYGRRALDGECSAIRNAGEGQKHHTLNRAAWSIGGLVACGELDEGEALGALRAALYDIRDRCDDFRHAEQTLETAFADGKAAPRAKPAPLAPRAEPFGLNAAHTVRLKQTFEIPTGEEASKDADGPPLPLIYFDQVQASLDASDFVEGILTEEAMSVVYGPSNCGKTFFVSDLAMHVATGKTWRGKAIEAGGVIYCALEGSHGIANRVAAWRKHYGYEGVEVPFAVVPVSINLLDPEADREKLARTVAHAAEQMGVPVKLIVIDTLSRAMAGGNENAPDDMGALVASADFIRQTCKAHICFIHHSGKDEAKGARGHSLLRAATDTEIEISRPDSQAPSVARVTKQREMEIEGEFVFKLATLELGTNRRGKPVTSCIVEAVEGQAAVRPKRPIKLPPGVAVCLRALDNALCEQGRTRAPAQGVPLNVLTVTEAEWRTAFYAELPDENANARRMAFTRGVTKLKAENIAGFASGLAWLVKNEKGTE
jgi:hypothetical protein